MSELYEKFLKIYIIMFRDNVKKLSVSIACLGHFYEEKEKPKSQ